MMKQNIAILTTARSEYYQLQPILSALRESPAFNAQLFVSGSHLSAKFGKSERDIETEGYSAYERLPILLEDDSKMGAAVTSGLAVQMIAGALTRNKTDILLLAGDRYETLAAAVAATCVNVPIGHLHGGELTEGAMDDSCRHAITKLSALHFVSSDVYRARVMQMGEPSDRVFTIGAPLIDQILNTELVTEDELSRRFGLELVHPVALFAYHPVTREQSDAKQICRCILEDLHKDCKTIIMTAPNQDPGHDEIVQEMESFRDRVSHTGIYENLGSQIFLSLLSCADIMVGNSSSGIHEAVSFRLPVVNIGTRQAGRLQPGNVISCAIDSESIKDAISSALSPVFRQSLVDMTNPYGDGRAADRLLSTLALFAPFGQKLYRKSFADGADVKSATDAWIGANSSVVPPQFNPNRS